MVKRNWLGPTQIEIHYDQLARVLEKQKTVNGVTIRYVPDL